MSLIGRPVLIKSGDFAGHFGVVKEFGMGLYLVQVGPWSVGVSDTELEPYFNLKEVADVRVQELDEDGDPVGTTELEKKVKGFGLSSEELAGYVADFVTDAAARVRGIGNDQYSVEGGWQKFEELTLPELFEFADEELLDMMNYCVMLRIRLIRLFNAIMDADDCVSEEVETDEDSDA